MKYRSWLYLKKRLGSPVDALPQSFDARSLRQGAAVGRKAVRVREAGVQLRRGDPARRWPGAQPAFVWPCAFRHGLALHLAAMK